MTHNGGTDILPCSAAPTSATSPAHRYRHHSAHDDPDRQTVEGLVAAQWRLVGALCAGPNPASIVPLEAEGCLCRAALLHCLCSPGYDIGLRERCAGVGFVF